MTQRLKKQTRKHAETRSFSKSPIPTQGRKKLEYPPLHVLFWSHVINSLSHCQESPDSIKLTHMAALCTKTGHISVQNVPGGCTACVCVEHIPATCIPWSWNTAEIPLPTHTPEVCVFPFHSASSCENYSIAYIATEKDLVNVWWGGGVIKGIGQLNRVTWERMR